MSVLYWWNVWGGAGGCNRSQGGAEAEREERNRQIEAKRQKERDNAESFRRMQEEARTRRGRLQEELAESQLLDEEENAHNCDEIIIVGIKSCKVYRHCCDHVRNCKA